jgi:hypothetical protein
VWIGFFYEGVYGNLGWGAPDGPEPIGWPGLLRTTPQLEVDWRFPADQREPIDECSALNVTGEVAWTCSCFSSAVIRVEDSRVGSWSSRLDGVRAFVVGDGLVALAGGHAGERDRIVLGRLERSFTELSRAQLVMPDGSQVPPGAAMHGRRDELHVFVGHDWFVLALGEIAQG